MVKLTFEVSKILNCTLLNKSELKMGMYRCYKANDCATCMYGLKTKYLARCLFLKSTNVCAECDTCVMLSVNIKKIILTGLVQNSHI